MLYSGELGKIENKEFLKLWIEYPFNMVNLYNKKSNRLILDGFEVELCDDYDDIVRLYIKFIADEIKVSEAYPVLRKYNRYQNDYLDNLSKFKKVLGNNEFRYFSSTLDNCLCTKVDFIDGNLYIYYENVFESYDKFVLKFINILCYDDISVDELVEVIKDFLVNGINATDIRLIDYNDDRFIFGILLSYEKELIINCSNIILE